MPRDDRLELRLDKSPWNTGRVSSFFTDHTVILPAARDEVCRHVSVSWQWPRWNRSGGIQELETFLASIFSEALCREMCKSS